MCTYMQVDWEKSGRNYAKTLGGFLQVMRLLSIYIPNFHVDFL